MAATYQGRHWRADNQQPTAALAQALAARTGHTRTAETEEAKD